MPFYTVQVTVQVSADSEYLAYKRINRELFNAMDWAGAPIRHVDSEVVDIASDESPEDTDTLMKRMQTPTWTVGPSLGKLPPAHVVKANDPSE